MRLACATYLLVSVLCRVRGVSGYPHDNGSDLLTFLSRPDIRAPKMIVRNFHDTAITPGFIFTAPYNHIRQGRPPDLYSPSQIGPHVYDEHGHLIWSGAELTQNFVVTDFRPIVLNGTFHMTFILQETPSMAKEPKVHGYILNSSYDVVEKVDLAQEFDVHEFLPNENATSFLRITRRLIRSEQLIPGENITLADTCAVEMDIAGQESFRFCSSDKISIDESFCPRPTDALLRQRSWDLFHMNSLEKFSSGDYLISIRHTNAIYRVSQATGEIVWRLGGKLTDFDQDFNFSAQHDARIVSHNSSVTIISFLDNAAADVPGYQETASFSSFKVVALYETEVPKRAEILRQYNRPDGKLTRLRGDGQYFTSGGAFVAWSEGSYASEFAPDGRVVQEARFEWARYSSYRTYKASFIGTPNSLPTLLTIASSSNGGRVSTTSYVSWNGATEIAIWEFLGSDDENGEYTILGRIPRIGFETSFISRVAWRYTRVRGRDKYNNVLGESRAVETQSFETVLNVTTGQTSISNLDSATVGWSQQSKALVFGLSAVMATSILIAFARHAGVTSRCLYRVLSQQYSNAHTYMLVSQDGTTEQ